MCASGPPTATLNVKILFQMQKVWYRKNLRGWVPPTLVARRLTFQEF